MHEQITSAEQYTAKKIESMREALAGICDDARHAIVVNGSYARGEASDESDLDYYTVCDSNEAHQCLTGIDSQIKAALRRIVPKAYADGGAFGHIETIKGMTENIGGDKDVNAKITRRLLFLLEGNWLYNKEKFVDYRNEILARYIKESISDHQFCRFLLNDLIRYYRTICVDFEHKTSDGGKAWGTRNIKLVFSRKLLYFSGILVTAETWQQSFPEKLEIVKNLLDLTPIRRIEHVCGSRADQALNKYAEFLTKMADPAVRKMTDSASESRDRQSPAFRLMKNEGHHFSWLLAKLLKDTYDSSHPIHNALVV